MDIIYRRQRRLWKLRIALDRDETGHTLMLAVGRRGIAVDFVQAPPPSTR